MDPEINPYRAPAASIGHFEAEEETYPFQIAGKGRRFGTLLVDYAGYFVCSFALGVVTALIFGDEGIESLQKVPDLLLGLIIITGYYCFFEGIWGRTPGKLIFGTRVVDAEGRKPAFGRILGRTLCRYIPFEAFSFLTKRGWHDGISGTYVVLARRVDAEDRPRPEFLL